MQSSRDAQGYALPANVHPSDNVCISLVIPNDPAYIQAVIGALYDTTIWISWQRDAANTAIQASTVMKACWETMLAAIGACPVSVQFRQPDDCHLQASFDAGATWSTIFDAYSCGYGAGLQAISDKIHDGTLATNPQPAGQGGGTSGQCYDYDVTLSGSGTFVFPVAIDAKDVVTVSLVSGAWSDGAGGILSYWYCAEGGSYLLGGCEGGGKHTVSTDPAPSIYHMRLIALINGANPVDAFNTTFIVPSGISGGQLTLQANDSPLNDNLGSITFHAQVCKGTYVVFTAVEPPYVNPTPTVVSIGDTFVIPVLHSDSSHWYYPLAISEPCTISVVASTLPSGAQMSRIFFDGRREYPDPPTFTNLSNASRLDWIAPYGGESSITITIRLESIP